MKASDYLLRRINGIEEPVVVRAREARSAMIAVATEMIAELHWADFETLVDLIFARAGWQRISRVGGTQADTDLVLEQPTTGEIAFVQVKSKAAQAVLDNYIDRFRRSGKYDRSSSSVTHPQGPHPWTTRPVSISGSATGSPMRRSKPGCSIGLPSALRERENSRLGGRRGWVSGTRAKLDQIIDITHGLVVIIADRDTRCGT